jgi:hypothetical protein
MRHVLLPWPWLLLLAVMATVARGDDFRIETKVYVGKAKTPASENVTLFQSGFVYDYLSNPQRVAVFDRPHGRFVLLDPTRQLKAEVKTEDVLVFAKKSHDVAAGSSNPFLKFAAHPKFETDFTPEGELTLASPFITYKLQTMPTQSPEASKQYRDFSDWYARFNAMTNPGSTPPPARLALNEELDDRGLVPTEVQLTLAGKGVHAATVRSEHHVSWRLLPKDMERISETANELATFKVADLAELRFKDPSAKR